VGRRRESGRLSNTNAPTAGDALATALHEAGVTHAFTVPGESFLGLLDALHGSPIRVVATRHEAGAGFMAEGFGQLTGRPAACLVTRAVGTANLSIALHTARQNSTPLIAVCGQVPRAVRGREAFQEADLATTFGALCKGAVEVTDATALVREAPSLFAEAVDGRPGPVLLSVPEEVFDATLSVVAPVDPSGRAQVDARSESQPTLEAVLAALRLLCTSRTGVIFAGSGVLRARASGALVELAHRTEIPVIASWRRPDVFPNDDELYLGMAGLGAPPAVRARLEAADAILAIGTRLSEITTFGYAIPRAGTQLVHVDAEPVLPGREPATLAIRADAAEFLQAAIAAIDAGRVPEVSHGHADRRAAVGRDRARYVRETTLPDPGDGNSRDSGATDRNAVDPAAVIRALRETLPDGAVMTTDAGNFAGWAARYLPVPRNGRFLGPTSGAMGYALPAAIGAAIAEPDRAVVALAGDGGFAMLMAELETAVREEARLAALVFDNAMYGTIRMHQEDAHPGRVVATDLGPIDFAAIAGACGATGITVDRNDHVPGAIRRALGSAGVSVVHLKVDPRYLSVDRVLTEAPGP
jgi:acetolactate synthase-1/2/3 large subunit